MTKTEGYYFLYGSIIRQAIDDFQMGKRRKKLSVHQKLNCYDAESYLFSPRRLEKDIIYYGLENVLAISFIRRHALRGRKGNKNRKGNRNGYTL